MRRLIGLVALAALIFGAWWLVHNGYDMLRIAHDMGIVEDAAPSSEATQPAESSVESTDLSKAAGPGGDTAGKAAETPAAPPAAAVTPDGEAAGASAAASQGPTDSTPAAGESAAATSGDVPTFDIVRVEPSGETVIAGLAAPNTTVEVLSGPEAVATAEANERGEWALVLEKPLPPGTHDLAIRTTSKDKSTVTLSDQRVAVAVPEDKNEEPLVVLSTPKAPSSVMQGPGVAPKESEIASAASGQPGAPASATQGSTEPAAPATPGVASAPEATPSAPTSTDSEKASGSEVPAAASPGEPAGPGQSPSGSEVAVAKPPAGATPQVGSEASAPAKPEPQVGVAAVEAESDGSLYVAGTATTKDPVRVYIDDQLIGEAEPTEGGTWLLETKREVAPGGYTIRADQVDSGNGKVIVRAEVPFEREIAVAALKQSSESGDNGSAEASGSIAGPMTVIIKRGDNLWRISRELYGHGIRYSTIYQANREQIRNPDRIYPGQVFVLPAGDTAWQSN